MTEDVLGLDVHVLLIFRSYLDYLKRSLEKIALMIPSGISPNNKSPLD
jgi:spore coat protein CotF